MNLHWLRALYLPSHHRRVRRRSDHPLQHARRLLQAAAERQGNAGLLCDVGAGTEPEVTGPLWAGRRLAIDLVPGRGVQVAADGCRLPLREGSVDLVLLMQVLEHVPDPGGLLRECARVLVPGGHVCLTVPQYWITHNHPADYYRYTREGIEHLCRESGLRVERAWAMGGPMLVVFHAIELNLPQKLRILFVALAYAGFDWLDGVLTRHGNRPGTVDAVGWAVLAIKPSSERPAGRLGR